MRVQHIQSALGGRRFKHMCFWQLRTYQPTSLTQLSERTDLSTVLSVLWVVALHRGYSMVCVMRKSS